jgi:hypothetical protein
VRRCVLVLKADGMADLVPHHRQKVDTTVQGAREIPPVPGSRRIEQQNGPLRMADDHPVEVRYPDRDGV